MYLAAGAEDVIMPLHVNLDQAVVPLILSLLWFLSWQADRKLFNPVTLTNISGGFEAKVFVGHIYSFPVTQPTVKANWYNILTLHDKQQSTWLTTCHNNVFEDFVESVWAKVKCFMSCIFNKELKESNDTKTLAFMN